MVAPSGEQPVPVTKQKTGEPSRSLILTSHRHNRVAADERAADAALPISSPPAGAPTPCRRYSAAIDLSTNILRSKSSATLPSLASCSATSTLA